MVEKLVEYLKKCDDAYYNSDQVLVNNDTYDALVGTLRRLAPGHPYLLKVGAFPREGSNMIGRLIPMGTLVKYHTDEEVKEWFTKENTQVYIAPKYDGFGVELVYQDGRLVMASTRGDKFVGEDVTTAMMWVRNVPITLPDNWKGLQRVRGEAIVPRENHEALKSLGYTAMRNAVPGIVRSCRQDALVYVDFVAYEFFDEDNDRQRQRLKYSSLFNVEDVSINFEPDEFESLLLERNAFGEGRESYKYETDGVVLKTRYIKEDDLSHPEHQIAWKYKSNRETSTLRDIEFNVGATGNISVVGVFDEVEFQGAKLKRASIGSLQRYEELKPAIGDIVEVSRRGDIIPYIEDVVVRNSDDYKPQDVCPCCGIPLVDYKCVNKVCSDKVKLKIFQYIRGIGVKGVGYALVESMVNAGMIKSLIDIYYLDPENIASLPRQGKSAVEKWRAVQCKEISTLEFLCAYPFENSGKSTWKTLLAKYSLEELLYLTVEELTAAKLKGLGANKVESLVSQLSESREEILSLMHVLNLH